MPAKTPIYLKATNSKKGKKCKLRDILSPDMISPPLGDFRHTIHIGKGGEQDAFGDMSFLQGKYDLLPGQEDPRSLQFIGHNEFSRANSASDDTFSETPSPVLKNAISLPAIGGSQALTLPLLSTVTFTPNTEPLLPFNPPEKLNERELPEKTKPFFSAVTFPPKPEPQTARKQSSVSLAKSVEPELTERNKPVENGKIHAGDNGYKWSAPHYSNGNGKVNNSTTLSGHYTDWLKIKTVEDNLLNDCQFEFTKEKSASEKSISNITGSLLSLELDLGPSILDEVLNVMDNK
ncbi:cdc42 effector protein 3 [Acipenser ruthenus]|uniref:cdc42 effector protein 3 n=1 Tax=Acipenser ruthenus TaxID=7906 RepID=UPI00145A3A4B|nr:cdc42 effector protein 3 [Acipenser ruthenus]XP_058879795.1 cdc42 effector protein 3 [Acipenser ruthenus]XP_058879796.1 cdc42 effector protein 3 [Acipenser ruthenus]